MRFSLLSVRSTKFFIIFWNLYQDCYALNVYRSFYITHKLFFSFNCFLSSSILSFYYCIIFMLKHFSTRHFLSDAFTSTGPAFYCFMGEGHHGSWFYFLPDYKLSDTNTALISKMHRCFEFYLLERGGRQRQWKVYWCCWFPFW